MKLLPMFDVLNSWGNPGGRVTKEEAAAVRKGPGLSTGGGAEGH